MFLQLCNIDAVAQWLNRDIKDGQQLGSFGELLYTKRIKDLKPLIIMMLVNWLISLNTLVHCTKLLVHNKLYRALSAPISG